MNHENKEVEKKIKMNKYDIDSGNLPKVLKVLELIVEFSDKKRSRKDEYETIPLSPKKPISTTKHCSDLINTAIYCHRYKEAVKLFWILCHSKGFHDVSLYKIGIVLLLNLEKDDKTSLCQNFFRSSQNLNNANQKEILLDFLLCAFKCGLPNVQRQVKELASRKTMSLLRKHNTIDSAYDSYLLLLDWCNTAIYSDMNLSQSQANTNEVLKIREYVENSDMFILKLMKFLELNGKQNEMEGELLQYVESNPDSVNAHVYLCTYLYHCDPKSDKLLNYLEILIQKCISDVRTLWLIEIWRKRGVSLLKILNYCFMFLDYPTNGKKAEGWKAMWKILKKTRQKLTDEEFQSVISFWETRRRSWSWMYFNPQQLIVTDTNSKLIAYKVAFLLFFGEGKKYTKKVSKYHPEIFEMAESL